MLLITGGKGFLGSHIVKISRDQNREILFPNSKELNLLNIKNIKEYVNDNKIKNIIHAAGYVGGINLHEEHPAKVTFENLSMGINIVEAISKIKNIRLLTVSTVCVYPENAFVPLREKDIHEGYPADITGYYGYSKRMIHVMCEAYKKEFGLNFLSIIPTNLYGPGDNYNPESSHVVSGLIERAHAAKIRKLKHLEVWGNKKTKRDFLYVQDCASWILKALDSNLSGKILNFGSNKEISIENLAKLICKIVGFKGSLKWDTGKPIGAKRRFLDTTLATKLLNYGDLVNLENGLAETYQDFLRKKNEN